MFGFTFFLHGDTSIYVRVLFDPPVTQLQKWAQVPPEHRANGETFDLPQASINDHRDGRMSYCLWLGYWMVIYEDSRGSPTQVGYVKASIL